uniref:Uncharacterized protein n=1 Tax=Molossus molossus TaxID=27622 RepID=A0A7J8JWF7_MOLMO|nr:hypothetical protein HJG59_007880 [Molossus molossus]
MHLNVRTSHAPSAILAESKRRTSANGLVSIKILQHCHCPQVQRRIPNGTTHPFFCWVYCGRVHGRWSEGLTNCLIKCSELYFIGRNWRNGKPRNGLKQRNDKTRRHFRKSPMAEECELDGGDHGWRQHSLQEPVPGSGSK